ncbi:hypothetical protein TSUD_409140 [Trifolium subterraneum]|uniref:Uncharacterized protein n=1 Tax=Trifolium subterraneum TaxID=3900 RepID=A0A2Z6P1I2_TRISU|nr:hypothetical protein TSUD_409140 [Trifolium subterraneum]
MDLRKMHTKTYSFKELDLSRLRELGSLVPFPDDFKKQYGKLLSILNTDVKEGALNTLVQFYDPIYHCFTFVDYQLVPTLEEYSYWVGLPISNKGGSQGLTSNFLFGKAFMFAEKGSVDTFEAILALLIYGLVLFANVDYFVDSSDIQVFLGGNPVPTLLADAYHSIHHRTQKGGGLIICCAPLLYRWFISHIPQTSHFQENPEKLRWSQRIMPLTSADIVWYNAAYDVGAIIDSYGDFPNVPLLGIRGRISYNPILARRQFRYPMKDRPESVLLTGIFYFNEEGSQYIRKEFARAWYNVLRERKDQLGRKLGIVSEDYTKWVISRAIECGMPYSFEKSSSVDTSSSTTPPSVIPFETIDEFQELLTKLRLEKDAWERKFRESELENKELKEKLKEQEKMLSLQDVKVARRIRYKPTRVYNTRSKLKSKMNNFEEENHMVREQMTTMQTEIEKLTGMVASLMAAQNQVPAPAPQSSNTLAPPPISSAPLSAPQFVMSEGYPWGMPVGFLGEESCPVVSEIPHVQPAVPIPQLGNTLPQVTATWVDDLQIKYDEIQREMMALRGKDLFGQDAHELCLVPDVVVPHKFKVPDFEKYKGSTCPKAHLIMYAKKMSTQTSNDKLLIHYFQDSLTGAALRWDELRALAQKERKSFKEYAQRWRELAAQIRPLVEEKELFQRRSPSLLRAPDRDELRALTQKDREFFKEYAQRWRELAAQIRPLVEEKELFQLYLHTLSPFFYEKMVGVVSRSFTEMVEMGMCLEEGVRQGRLTRENALTNTAKKYGSSFSKKKEAEVGMTRPPPPVPVVLPTWYRSDLTCAFHQGAPGHDVERCYALKKAVQELIRNKVLSFKDENPNVQINPLPNHGSSVHLIQSCQETSTILSECLKKPQGCSRVQEDIQRLMDKGELVVTRKSEDVCVIFPEFNVSDRLEMIYNSGELTVTPLVICLPGPMPYTSLRAVPYRYDATMLQNGVETPIPSLISVDNIADNSKILRNGRILPGTVQGKTNNSVEKTQIPDSSRNGERIYEDSDEVLKMIKRSEYKIVDQLLQTPSKISILSLLMNSDAHREALMKVLDQAYVDHDVTLGQFGSIVGNVTACNNLSFSDEELPERGRDHNLALHISVICKSDSLSNVLVDTGSSLNVMSKITLDKLAYRGAPLRLNALIVKAFDGSRKSVIGEIDLPISVGPYEFQITFQVMDIRASYSSLLGRPSIHEAGAVTSTLHQKLKFVREGKLVIVNGEEALLVSHLSAFSYIGADVEDGTAFQGLSIEEGSSEKAKAPMKSVKDAQKVIQGDVASHWGRPVQLLENKKKEGLGCTPSTKMSKPNVIRKPFADIFRGAGFINAPPETNAIIEHEGEEEPPSLVTPGGICCNWATVDVPSVTPLYKLSINKPVEHNDPRPSPNFEFPVYEAVEEEDEEIPDEIRRLLDQEKRTIQPHEEVIESINLGSEEEKKEIKIGALLEASVKERVIVLLREYVDIFAWSYQDMPGLDLVIVEHHLPLKSECPPVKQKLRRTHPDMALKIKEEVQKQIDAGFLITSEYPQWLANIVPVPKKDGKVRMCVDYRDLNKASPKDDFPLPHIDVLVDNTAKSKVFSFMDGFSGYNKIKMAVEDREKTSFITPWGTFCYKVMLFGLTNAGATYQRGMTTLFHDMMHKEIEVYVDDMIVKSGTEEEHVEYLLKMFQRLRKYRLRLNPNKCTFGVRSGKLLGFIVSQKGIELDPDKVRAIREMPVPQTEKQVRGFLGRLNYISRFISHMTATGEMSLIFQAITSKLEDFNNKLSNKELVSKMLRSEKEELRSEKDKEAARKGKQTMKHEDLKEESDEEYFDNFSKKFQRWSKFKKNGGEMTSKKKLTTWEELDKFSEEEKEVKLPRRSRPEVQARPEATEESEVDSESEPYKLTNEDNRLSTHMNACDYKRKESNGAKKAHF